MIECLCACVRVLLDIFARRREGHVNHIAHSCLGKKLPFVAKARPLRSAERKSPDGEESVTRLKEPVGPASAGGGGRRKSRRGGGRVRNENNARTREHRLAGGGDPRGKADYPAAADISFLVPGRARTAARFLSSARARRMLPATQISNFQTYFSGRCVI